MLSKPRAKNESGVDQALTKREIRAGCRVLNTLDACAYTVRRAETWGKPLDFYAFRVSAKGGQAACQGLDTLSGIPTPAAGDAGLQGYVQDRVIDLRRYVRVRTRRIASTVALQGWSRAALNRFQRNGFPQGGSLRVINPEVSQRGEGGLVSNTFSDGLYAQYMPDLIDRGNHGLCGGILDHVADEALVDLQEIDG